MIASSPNETLKSYHVQARRTMWLEQLMTQNKQIVIDLATSAFHGANRAAKAVNLQFELDYDARSLSDEVGLECFRYGSYNIAIFLKSLPYQGRYCNVTLRLPFPDRFYAMECYESEYATLLYIKRNSQMPVPLPIACGFSEELQSPYILTDTIPGFRLDDLSSDWEHMRHGFKASIQKQIAKFMANLFRMQFPKISSLHKTDGQIEQGRPITEAIDSNGIHVGCDFSKVFPPMKTFSTEEDFFEQLLALHDEMWYQQTDLLAELYEPGDKSIYIEEYIWRKRFRILVKDWMKRVKPPKEGLFCLWHPDLRAGNILVNPMTGEVTGILDWERAFAVPLSLYTLPTFSSRVDFDITDEEWQEYQDSIEWSLQALSNTAFDFGAYFKSFSRNDYAIARRLMQLQAFELSGREIKEMLDEFPPYELDDDDMQAINAKVKQVESALAKINDVFTPDQTAKFWFDKEGLE